MDVPERVDEDDDECVLPGVELGGREGGNECVLPGVGLGGREGGNECVLPGGVGVGGCECGNECVLPVGAFERKDFCGRKHARNVPTHGCRRIRRSSARSNLQKGIKLEHRRCNRIEGRT